MVTEQNSRTTNDVTQKDKVPALPIAPPGRFGTRHLQILLLFFGMMMSYALRVMLSVAIVAMTISETVNPDFKTYDWNTSEQSFILSSFFWGYVVTQLPSGYLATKWSAHKLLSLGLFLCSSLGMVIPMVVDAGGWGIVCACRFGMGLCQGCVMPGIQTLLARWVPPSERARLGTFAYAGGLIGTVLTMVISGQLAASSLGWPSIFYFFGILVIAWSILFYIFGCDSPTLHSKISEAEKYFILQSMGNFCSVQQQTTLKTPWRSILTSIPMWALIVAHSGQNWGFWMLLTEIPTYMSQIIGISMKENGTISALPYLAMWILTFPVSWLADYMLRRGISIGFIRKFWNTVAHWGAAFALLGLCFVNPEEKIVPIVLIIIAVGLSGSSICGYNINHIDLSPNFAGSLMSITNCIAGFISIIEPIICGWIINDQKNVYQWHTIFYVSALVYFLANLIFIIFGSGELQPWNDPSSSSSLINKHGKHSYQVPTISTVYNSTPIISTNYKSKEITD